MGFSLHVTAGLSHILSYPMLNAYSSMVFELLGVVIFDHLWINRAGSTTRRALRTSRTYMSAISPQFPVVVVPLYAIGLSLRLASEVRRTQRLAPRGRPTVSKLPETAHQRRGTPFPRSIPRRLLRLPCFSRVARPTSRTGLTIRVGTLRPDSPDAPQSTALLVLLLPWRGRCLYVS